MFYIYHVNPVAVGLSITYNTLKICAYLFQTFVIKYSRKTECKKVAIWNSVIIVQIQKLCIKNVWIDSCSNTSYVT
jgi:hypothetical protein